MNWIDMQELPKKVTKDETSIFCFKLIFIFFLFHFCHELIDFYVNFYNK